MQKNIKEKLIGTTGSISGIASVLGSWQICHNVCLGLIAVLGILGVTVVGMPLEFLTRIVIPMWTIAFALLLIIIVIYLKKPCISRNLILINSGLIIAGIPFQVLQVFQKFFWIVGGVLVLTGIYLFIRDRRKK